VGNAGMVGITIYNQVNQCDKPIGFIFRRKDLLSPDILRSVFDIMSQFNAKFKATDTLIVPFHSVRMPIRFGGPE